MTILQAIIFYFIVGILAMVLDISRMVEHKGFFFMLGGISIVPLVLAVITYKIPMP